MSKNGMRPVHPGEVLLQEFLFAEEELSIRFYASSLAEHSNMHVDYWDLFLRGRERVNARSAKVLARLYNTTPHFWLNLQRAYDEKVDKQ